METTSTIMETIHCKICASEFNWTPEPDEESHLSLFRPPWCDPCTETREQRLQAEEQAKRQNRIDGFMASVQAAIPPRFQDSSTSHPSFNARAWEKIRTWRPTSEKPWLTLISETGKCKTRMAFLLASHILREKVESSEKSSLQFRFTTSTEFTAAAQNLFSDRKADAFSNSTIGDQSQEFLCDCRRVDLLVLDDLGKGRLTPSAAAALFEVLDLRYAHNRPTIITTNSDPEKIFAGLDHDLAAPMAGRIYDASVTYQL